MKKIIVLIFLGYFLCSSHTTADYIPEVPIVKKPSINELISYYAKMYHVSLETLTRVMKCENKDFDPTKQSDLTYKKGNRWKLPAGSHEQSYGLVQIHLPDHKDITYEQATDPDFSIDFLAKNISKGKGEMWSCF